tara:strand:+ start:430 stop:567 length:138 start_codon:yes stop_codon:yes gene_type:complete
LDSSENKIKKHVAKTGNNEKKLGCRVLSLKKNTDKKIIINEKKQM